MHESIKVCLAEPLAKSAKALPKRAAGGLIFRSGFRDVHKAAPQPCDFLAQSTDRTNHSQSEKERSKNQATRCTLVTRNNTGDQHNLTQYDRC